MEIKLDYVPSTFKFVTSNQAFIFFNIEWSILYTGLKLQFIFFEDSIMCYYD